MVTIIHISAAPNPQVGPPILSHPWRAATYSIFGAENIQIAQQNLYVHDPSFTQLKYNTTVAIAHADN